LDLWRRSGDARPSIEASRQPGRIKYGIALGVEQALAEGVRGFARWGWNEGRHESFAYTEVNRSTAAGADVAGNRWARANDAVGGASGRVRGRVRAIAVAPQDHPTRVAFLIVKTSAGERVLSPAALTSAGASVRAATDASLWEHYSPSDGVLLLKRDLLDQQI